MGAGLFDLFTTRKAQERTLRPNDCVYPEPFDYAQDKLRRRAQGDAPRFLSGVEEQGIARPYKYGMWGFLVSIVEQASCLFS